MMHWGQYGWSMGLGWVWMVIFWGLVIAGIVYVVHSITGRSTETYTNETPLDMLKRRYAKGDISKEEYREMKDHLLKP